MHKPFHTLLFVALTFLLLGVISLIVPENGIYITDNFKIQYPTFASLFFEKKVEKTDISSIIALSDAQDDALEASTDTTTAVEKDSLSPAVAKLVKVDTNLKLITSIQVQK